MHLPHLQPFKRASIVFLTTCTQGRRTLLACPEVHEVLRNIWQQSADRNGWFVEHYVLMPDHAHLFACPGHDALPLADWMQLWKAIAAKRINQAQHGRGAIWQPDYFDRFLRSLHDYSEKWQYVALNPVRKGLTETPEAWPYRGTIHDLRCHASRD
ncbi:MAG TPA: transposase [Lacunisphaera sp.]